VFRANGMLAAALAGDQIRAMTRLGNSVIAKFGLPRQLHPSASRPPPAGDVLRHRSKPRQP